MPSDLRRVGRDLLVWMVALAATAQTASRAVQGFLDDRADHVVLYVATSILVLAIAVSIERIKGFLGGWS